MNKVFGTLNDYALVKEDASRVVVSYDLERVGDSDNYTWYEIYFYKKQGKPNFEKAKDAILNDINDRTDAKILSGMVWNEKKVWLSSENQFNFKAEYDLAVQTQGQSLPTTFKIGEDDEKKPVYYEFTEMDEFTNFYLASIAYIKSCLEEGWQKKDSIDFDVYKPYFPEDGNNNNVE